MGEGGTLMAEGLERGAPGTGVRLGPLSVVDDGGDVLVGRPDTGRFISVPPVGGVVVRALLAGASQEQAQQAAEAFAGEPVDVPGFVAALVRLGLADSGTDSDAGTDGDTDCTGDTDADGDMRARRRPLRTAAVQQRRYVHGLSQRTARRICGPAGWSVCAAALLFDAVCLVTQPWLRPVPAHVFFLPQAGLAVLLLRPAAYLVIGLHEAGHWVAARAAGLGARFGVDRRLYFLVFETDLSQIWSLPRRRRYGPLLAGLAVDGVSLALLLGVRMLAGGGPGGNPGGGPGGDGIDVVADGAAALAFGVAASMVWQCMVFLRTDLYGVLVTATGCRDLWRVKSLLLRRALHRLGPGEAEQLREAHPADLRVGAWYRWVHLVGLVVAAGWFAAVLGPVLWTLLGWTVDGLRPGPGRAGFWGTLAVSAVLWLPQLSVAALWLRQTTMSRRGSVR